MKFIDLCSGIGAAHLAFKKLSCQCVGYAEIDKKAEKTYKLFFGSELKNYGDLMKIKSSDLPSFDILLAGFPCQSFSVVGQRKGFIDERGQIIFGIKKILKEKKPKFFLLENVKGILSAGNGDVINVIVKGLEAQGYNVYCKTLNSYNYGTPQIRERVYFVGIRKDLVPKFKFPDNDNNIGYNIQRFLINNDDKHILSGKPLETFKNKYLNNKYNFGKYNFDDLIKNEYLVIDTRQSDLRLYIDRVPTIRTGRQGIIYVKNGKLRKLSAMEALLLQGFDEDMSINADSAFSQTALLSQAGNAMTVNVMHDLGKIILESYA
ncbi:MAG: DNA (cytosine-5-)-methyltransferase [Rickettsiales bacterium]|nr:DNA (cytosine-5-)-methyltransferase [Pseudomonadota bacterium]MDA0965910.1 DNA (cytosine-5-)-methyltransferase [Pseudomonadota bacterium]MDG4542620.1 DNA (cytosine-5-)-methyltransferase [Rickettsiales bacterium]MDG4545124.1 DNA (cytosine-5-)-methyltransferase [Rickettsiales bacterium]MDG4547247.1 DNA (cytosine-5-)-methyltransferase [Rickettsiales bacterium]